MNVFLITSTINCNMGVFSVEERIEQTKETIASVRRYAPGSQIIFIDNSNDPIHQELDIDYRVPFYRNMFTRWTNDIGSKGIGEAYMLSECFKFMRENVIRPTRLFKMSGRYKLAEGFDIKEYDDPKYKGMYAFRVNDWDVSSVQWPGNQTVRYLETRLYSMCGSLIDEYEGLVHKMFHTMLTSYGQLMCNWEMNHCQVIPDDKLIAMNPIYVEGLNAVDGVYRFE